MTEQIETKLIGKQSRPLWPLLLGTALLVLILAAAALWARFGGEPAELRVTTARVGSIAPELELPMLVNGMPGGKVKLSSLAGRSVVLNFWATWCGPCREEFPTIEAKYIQYRTSHDLMIVGIDAQSDGGPAAAQQFVDQMGATYQFWLDTDGTAEEAYRVQALPTTVFIDRKGVIQDLLVGGPMTADTLEKELKRIF